MLRCVIVIYIGKCLNLPWTTARLNQRTGHLSSVQTYPAHRYILQARLHISDAKILISLLFRPHDTRVEKTWVVVYSYIILREAVRSVRIRGRGHSLDLTHPLALVALHNFDQIRILSCLVCIEILNCWQRAAGQEYRPWGGNREETAETPRVGPTDFPL